MEFKSCSSGQFIAHPQPYEHVQLCCPDMESLPIEKYKCKPTDNIRPVLELLHAY